MTLDVYYTIKLATLSALSAFALNLAEYLYTTILRPRWYTRHFPDATAVQVDPVADYDPAWGFRDNVGGCLTGPVVRYPNLLSPPALVIADKVALHDMLISQPTSFPKPAARIERQLLGDAFDKGLTSVAGDVHRRQRKIMSPSFGPAHMKSLYPIFIEKALKLRESLLRAVTDADPSPTVNIYEYTERVSLDTIASAGFGYETNSLAEGPESPLFAAFHQVSKKRLPLRPLPHFVTRFIPAQLLDYYFSRFTKESRNAVAAVKRIGDELVDEKKKAATYSIAADKPVNIGVVGRDILSVLVKANLAPGLSPRQRMSDEEVTAQIITFFLAGKGTTSTAIAWAVYGLCQHPDVQRKLHGEVSAVATEAPTYEELNSLPFLDAVVRETLRVYSLVPGVSREVTRDTILPLSKPYVDKAGNNQASIFVAKNTQIYIPVLEMSRNPDVWGPDASSFKPERWLQPKLPEGVRELPSIAMPSFLAGPRACIGFRFALIEIKVVLFTLFKSFKFQLGVPGSEIEADTRNQSITRPTWKSRPDLGLWMPVTVSRIEHDL